MGAALVLALGACQGSPPPPPPPRAPTPVLVWASDAPPERVGAAGTLFVQSLGSAGQRALTEALDGLRVRLEARSHPLILDLETMPVADQASAGARTFRPIWSAAATLAPGVWRRRGGWLVLRAACEGADRCWPVDQVPDAALRLAAWPVTHAAVLRGPPAALAIVAARLRLAATRAGSAVALVLDDATLSGAVEGPSAALVGAARRLVDRAARLELSGLGWLDEAMGPAVGAGLDALTGPGELLVVPRLSAVARRAAFRAEVVEAMGEGSVVWVRGE